MVAKKSTAPAGGNKAARPVESGNTAASMVALAKRDEAALASATAPVSEDKRTADGGRGRGPKSALEGGVGSRQEAEATKGSGQVYSVQIHTDEKGLQVQYYSGESGDEAAGKALAANKYRGTSIRGVDVASAPDANSMGGERDAAIMISGAANTGHIINSLGTEANAKTSAELAKADVSELGE